MQRVPAYLQIVDWSDLPFFLAVARAGQIGRAALTTGSDATTVGRRIRRLETALGERLFEQTAHGQNLTPAGRDLLLRVEAMDEIAGGIRSGPAPDLRGTIRLSTAEGFGTWFISRHIGALAERHPGLSVEIAASSGFLSPSRRETDLAILLHRPRRGPLIARKLTNYALRLYASRAYLAERAPPVAAADLHRHRLIGYIPDILTVPELRYLDEVGSGIEPELKSSSINAQHQMIAAGAGVGVLPCFIGDVSPDLVPVLPDTRIGRSFWLVAHRETSQFPNVQAVSLWLTELVAAHAPLLAGARSSP